MHLITAIRVFFRVLFSGEVAEQVRRILADGQKPESGSGTPTAKPKPVAPRKPAVPVRSEALTLLATLQREARFIDFIKESLSGFSDAQVGAVARDVHRDCRSTLDRLFAFQSTLPGEEGARIDVPQGFDPGRYHLTGNVTGEPPYHGTLVHHGWEAAKCELAQWSGSKEAVRVVAPVEVELK